MVKAIWNGKVIAESDRTIIVEGNHYFPPADVKPGYLEPTASHTVCPWKGTASYYTLGVDGKENSDAAWYYPAPKDAAARIKGYVAFWHGVEVQADGPDARGRGILGGWLKRAAGRAKAA